jgi:A/G-specific adenine glycosylase
MARRTISSALLAWYDAAGRDLPWRRSRDPYAIWVSEIMLQQTQVSTVIPYYERWMKRFPTLRALARAPESDVLLQWQGLGYYRRARNLHAGAALVFRDRGGRLPETAAELRELPGIGAYTAGAISSIAFGQREPVVDGNVVRVITRLFGLRGDPARAPLKNEISERASALVDAERPGDFNQALMELGATLCTPSKPECTRCPVAKACVAKQRGIAEELPETAKRPAATALRVVAAVVERDTRVLVVRLEDRAPRWAGLWVFPFVEVPSTKPIGAASALALRAAKDAAGVIARDAKLSASVRHAITRFKVTLDAYACRYVSGATKPKPDAPIAWKRPKELEGLAMPAPHRKIAERHHQKSR